MRAYADRVVWITGASSGIGKALARSFADGGARLILSARNRTALHELAAELGVDRCRVLEFDAAETGSIDEVVARAVAVFGAIDLFVHSAGVSQRSLAEETSPEVIDRILKINFISAARITTRLLPDWYRRGSGHIVIISSLMGKFGTPMRSAYCASKHALHGYYETVAAEAAGRGVSVTLVVPGWVRTNISRNALSGDGSRYDTVDPGLGKAKPPEAYTRRILNAIARKRFEVTVAMDAKNRLGLILKRLAPGLLRRLLSRVSVT